MSPPWTAIRPSHGDRAFAAPNGSSRAYFIENRASWLRYQRELLDVRGPNDPEMTTIGRGDRGERQPFSRRHNGRIGESKLRVLRHQFVCAAQIRSFERLDAHAAIHKAFDQ